MTLKRYCWSSLYFSEPTISDLLMSLTEIYRFREVKCKEILFFENAIRLDKVHIF